MSNDPHTQSPSLLTHLKGLASAHAANHSPENILLATAVVLLEIACSDHSFDKFEKSIISSGLKSLFRASDEEISNVMSQARSHLNNLRGSSAEITVLKESLDPRSRAAVAKLIDDLVNSHGGAQGFEGYLRNRTRQALGLPIIPMPSSNEESH